MKTSRKSVAATLLALGSALLGTVELNAAGPYQYFPITPCRVADSRAGSGFAAPNGPPNLSAGPYRNVQVKGRCGIPADAAAVSVNAAILNPTAVGFFSMWPAGGPFPTVSTINFVAGEPGLANGAIVPLAVTSTVGLSDLGLPGDLSIVYGNDGSPGHTCHYVLDVTGYFK